MRKAEILLRVDNVSHRFGGSQALEKVSFDVRRGEILAAIGPNGAGKSTLMNVISGFLSPDQGELHFKGDRINGMRPDQVNRLGVARTFQAAEVLRGMTVCENVTVAAVARSRSGLFAGMLGRTGPTMRKLRASALQHLSIVGIEHLAETPAAQLSAGQQRLLAVARALATDAELLILDEPAAGLNGVEKNRLAEVVLAIRERGVTVIFVEHDLNFVGRLAERMVVLDRGRVIARGLPDAVRTDEAVLKAYMGNTVLNLQPRVSTPRVSEPPLLKLEQVSVRYDNLAALSGVDLTVHRGEVVALIGANGAGKSTLLKTVAGIVKPVNGSLRFDGSDLAPVSVEKRTALGIGLAPEGRALFAAMSVRDNLLMGSYDQMRRSGLLHVLQPHGKPARETLETMEDMFELFPRLKERIDQQAGTMSGGEAQMLVIARALMNRPRLLMLDEPSFGLAPQVTREILELLPRLAARGISVLLVEQNARSALQVAERGYVLVNGEMVLEGQGDELLQSDDLARAYLGASDESIPSVPQAAAPQVLIA